MTLVGKFVKYAVHEFLRFSPDQTGFGTKIFDHVLISGRDCGQRYIAVRSRLINVMIFFNKNVQKMPKP